MFIHVPYFFVFQGWYIVTYALGIYHLNLFIAFLSPKIDPALEFEGKFHLLSFINQCTFYKARVIIAANTALHKLIDAIWNHCCRLMKEGFQDPMHAAS